MRNDAAVAFHDLDGDGLGKELEDALGLCWERFSYAIARIPGWRLDLLEARYVRLCEEQATDDAERDECVADYLGFLDEHVEATFNCELAVDLRDTDGDGLSDRDEVLGRTGTERDQALPYWGADPRHKDMFVEVDFSLREPEEEALRMPPATARKFASFYQDDVGIFNHQRRSDHAASLVNPDELPGIDVHMDTGVAAEEPADAVTYGDWGGYDAVPPVRDGDSWKGAKFTTAWKDYMSSERYGLFRYQLPYATGGGSNPINHLAFSGGLNSPWVLAHESGHANGLHHYGPNWSELRGVNCKPNYVSLMNYAFNSGRVGFSDGQSAAPLNNARLVEWEAVASTETAYLDMLKDTYKYYVDYDNGHVDWNRDGLFAPAGTTVRAQANNRNWGSCEGTRLNSAKVPDTVTYLSPAMARLKGRLYVFHSAGGLLRYHTSDSPWNCAAMLEEGEVCGTWEDWKSGPLNATQGVDVVKFGSAGDPELLVVANDFRNQLWEARVYVDSKGQERWTNPVRVPGTADAVGEPSLVRMNSCLAYLSYKDSDGHIVLKTLSRDEGWGEDEVVTFAAGGQPVLWEHASPAIGRAYLAWKPNAPALYGAFADSQGRLRLYGYDPLTRVWENTNMMDALWRYVSGRPTMAWVPDSTEAETPGRLHIAFVKKDTDPGRNFDTARRIVTTVQSYVKVTENADGAITREERVGLMADFDNVWMYAFGIDFFYEAGVDTNLKAVYSNAGFKPEHRATVRFRPVADGVVDYTYSDHDDWEALRVGVCRNVVNPGNLIEDPIECPVGTWDVRENKRAGDDRNDPDDSDEDGSDKRDLSESETTSEEFDDDEIFGDIPPTKAQRAGAGAVIGLPAGLICPEDVGPIFDGGIIPPLGF